jgi:predicted glycogen debranching enzyme
LEWLETDGLGGFAMGTAVGFPMRRYHSLLTTAVGTPANRICLLNAVEVWAIINNKQFPLSTFVFGAENMHPNGIENLKAFTFLPFPTWNFVCDGVEIQHELFMVKNRSLVCLSWQVLGKGNAELEVRPFLSGRSYHDLHKENNAINLQHQEIENYLKWNLYNGLPSIYACANGEYQSNSLWFKNVTYDEDRQRGAAYQEDWASPGIFKFTIDRNKDAGLLFSADKAEFKGGAAKIYLNLRKEEEKRRSKFKGPLSRAADSYIVKRGEGKTIIAGYPWFADWGRDTFISMRGLCLANERLDDAKDILVEWSKTVKNGMLPNRFIEAGEEPEYNSVDATLWFIIACFEYVKLDKKSTAFFAPIIETIIDAFVSGTQFNIGVDLEDGLLRAGISGVQLTWMDAKIGDYVVTPRIGKPVEIQALWLNALKISTLLSDKHSEIYQLSLKSFRAKFWNAASNCLFDVIDCNHEKGNNDGSIRPNQVFAVGGLPFAIIEDEKAGKIVECIENELYIQHAIRTLSPKDPNYRGHYTGDTFQRDSSYHQGTAWPWLLGPFVEAWLRVRDSSKIAKNEAYNKFFKPYIENLNAAGLGHLSEIHDGDAPFNSRGCPFQAWSVGEALRLEKLLLT